MDKWTFYFKLEDLLVRCGKDLLECLQILTNKCEGTTSKLYKQELSQAR